LNYLKFRGGFSAYRTYIQTTIKQNLKSTADDERSMKDEEQTIVDDVCNNVR